MRPATSGESPRPNASKTTSRTAALDGVRALAALSVVTFHVWLYTAPDPALPDRTGVANRALFELHIGLILFFVLTGFLLARPFARSLLGTGAPPSLGTYALRRGTRILPAYYVAIAGSVLLLWGAAGAPGVRLPPPDGLLLFAVLGQNYSAATMSTLNPVVWTLGVEVGFYALLPVLAWCAVRARAWRPGTEAGVLAALVAVGFAWNALVHVRGGGPLVAKALPAFLPYFATGIASAWWLERRARDGRRHIRPGTSVAVAVAALFAVVGTSAWHATAAPRVVNPLLAIVDDFPAAVGFAALIAVAAGGSGAVRGALAWGPLAAAGRASYGIYLWHVPLILWARHAGLLPSGFAAALALTVPVAIAAGAASWHFVERPALARAAARRRPLEAAPARALP